MAYNLNRANYGKRLGETTPVGDYPPNDYGVYDTRRKRLGMVSRRIRGLISTPILHVGIPPQVRIMPKRSSMISENIVDFRVLRGGGWNSEPEWLRAANRHGTSPAYAGIGARRIPLCEIRTTLAHV